MRQPLPRQLRGPSPYPRSLVIPPLHINLEPLQGLQLTRTWVVRATSTVETDSVGTLLTSVDLTTEAKVGVAVGAGFGGLSILGA